MTDSPYDIRPIGWVESPLIDLEAAPKQGDEGAPEVWLVMAEAVADGIRNLQVGSEVILLTWLDRARRDVLIVHPRGDGTPIVDIKPILEPRVSADRGPGPAV